jgi:hypothetical protein
MARSSQETIPIHQLADRDPQQSRTKFRHCLAKGNDWGVRAKIDRLPPGVEQDHLRQEVRHNAAIQLRTSANRQRAITVGLHLQDGFVALVKRRHAQLECADASRSRTQSGLSKISAYEVDDNGATRIQIKWTLWTIQSSWVSPRSTATHLQRDER